MPTILEQLYNGDLAPRERNITILAELAGNRNRCFQGYDDFLATLPEPFKIPFQNLIDDNLNCIPLELEQCFLDGFRLGVRMMAEVYAGAGDIPP